MSKSIAEKLFDGSFAEAHLEVMLSDAGVPFGSITWDHYDCSLELHEVPDDYRLSPEAQTLIQESGFDKVYVNHVNKWETHYKLPPGKGKFAPVKGWRVSYPHKRGEKERGILVEEPVPSWPSEWFKTGYAVVVSLMQR